MGQSINQKRNHKKYLKTRSGNTTYQNLQDSAKAVLREKFAVTNVYK